MLNDTEIQCGKTELSVSTDIILPEENSIRVVAIANPFTVGNRIDTFATEGDTLAEILENVQPDKTLRSHAHIFINDIRIPQENWHKVRPKRGTIITIRVIPQGGGGGGKNPLRTILMIAVIAASFAFGGPLGASLVGSNTLTIAGFEIAASAIGGAIISVVGNLLINALVPIRPPKLAALSSVNSSSSPTLFIEGARNQADPFGPVPIVLGRHLQKPKYGALPYTEIVGSDQYLRMVFVWGKGPLLLEDFKIGEDPLSNFSDVQIVNRAGFPSDGPLTLYTNDVYEENFAVTMTAAIGYVTRNSQANANQLSLDFVFPRGLVTFNDDGSKSNASVSFSVEYALVGSSDWKGGGLFIDLRTSPTIEAESPTVRLLRPNTVLPTKGSPIPLTDEFYYYSAPVTNPHRYDLITMDRLTGDLTVIKGVSVTESTVATIPTWGATVIPLAAVYVDLSGIGTIIDYRSQVTGWGSGFAVTYKDSTSVYIASGTLNSAQYTVTGATSEALRYNVNIAVPTEGQYQVRVRRLTADSTTDRVFSDLTWGVLRTINLSPPFDATGLATTELRIRANDQLQRVIDQFSGICTSILPDYDYLTDTWILRPTQNPASLGRAVLQGPGNARSLPDDRIDIEALEDFHNYCRVNNYQFNMVRDFVASVYDTVSDVWAAGFASPCEIDGKWSVVIDRDKTVAVQHFTPRNSWGFNFERTYPDRPHGWRIKFINENNSYTQDERIVYDDGYDATNATKFESFDVSGITNPDLVWKVGRRRIAEGRLRPEKYVFNVDIEHLVCKRGDLVYITHDVLGSGISAGRIKTLIVNGSSEITGITVDAPVDMEAGVTYGVQIRSVDGNRMQAIAATSGLDISTLNFVTPIPAGTQVAEGDLFGFGIFSQEKLEAVVRSIRRVQDMAAEVTCLPLARQIFSAETGSIPNFNPNITTQVGVVTPFITDIRSDESGYFYPTEWYFCASYARDLWSFFFLLYFTAHRYRGAVQKTY